MPGTKKGEGAERTLEEAREEQERVFAARKHIEAQLQELGEVRGGALEEESRRHEEALRRGQPTTALKKLRDLAADREELERALTTAWRVEARLALEVHELQIEEVRDEEAKARKTLQAEEARVKEAQEAHSKAQNNHYALYQHRNDLELRTRDLRERLAAVDPTFVAKPLPAGG